jgi:hypothetical protein
VGERHQRAWSGGGSARGGLQAREMGQGVEVVVVVRGGDVGRLPWHECAPGDGAVPRERGGRVRLTSGATRVREWGVHRTERWQVGPA